MEERKTIYLCLAHMSEEGWEQKYVKEAFDTNWVVPMGPNVNAFEQDLEAFVNESLPPAPSRRGGDSLTPNPSPEERGVSYDYRETADPALYDLLKGYAEEMRKNPTEAESIAWKCLQGKDTGFKFRRQHIIGEYIVDFVCLEKQLVVEIDGEYHNEWEQQVDDAQRTIWLESKGFQVVRFSNAEVVASPESFIEKVSTALKETPAASQVLPTGEDLGGALLNRKVVCLSAGTAAVHLALLNCGVKAGDEVCVQSFTFCASSHPITYLGAKPVFIGSEKDTWNMDPVLLEKAILDRKAKTGRYPKAIVPVALYGMPYDCERIMAIADKYGIPVVEDAAEGMGSRFDGQVLGTFGKYGVLSFNGNKMITTSGGGALICNDTVAMNDNDNCKAADGKRIVQTAAEAANEVMWYATQARDAYPYYEHTAIGYNYRMSNVCAGIGRGQMTVLKDHIAHHKHVQALYEELLKDVKGIHMHCQPDDPRYDANFWLCAATIDPEVHVKGQENAYKEVIKTAVGGAAGVIHMVDSPTTECQPNDNVEALRVFMLGKKVECRPVWKPMHCQPVYANGSNDNDNENDNLGCRVIEGPMMSAYTNGVEEEMFKVGFCLPAGPYVSDDDVKYIVECIKVAME